MDDKTNITLVAASDNHYAILLAVLIKSIEANHVTGEKIDFYIIDDGISSNNRKKIEASSDSSMTTIKWFKSKEVVPADIVLPTDNSAFPLTTYLRLFASYLVPKATQKLIYLDVDMVVTTDISKLWNIDLGENLFAAVVDLGEKVSCEWGGVPNYKALGMDPETLYFNAGLMMINPIRWREEDISNKVIQCINDNMPFVNYADQYGLNVVLANRWLILDKRWNSFSILNAPDPYVIHFLDIKPIFKSYNANPGYKEEFFKYLQLTAWKGFKPISDYNRLFRKAVIKLKKIPARLLRVKTS